MRRGLTYEEAFEYVGVKRRTFDEKWKPLLRSMKQGTSTLYDKRELDSLFDQFMSNDATVAPPNEEANQKDGDLSESILTSKGNQKWPAKPRVYKTQKTEPGLSTKKSKESEFTSAASKVMGKRMNI